MLSHYQISKITIPQRHVILKHVRSGALVPFAIGMPDSVATRRLLDAKILKPHPPNGTMRFTQLTAMGREVACVLLAEYAGTLIQAGAGRSPLEALLDRKTEAERLDQIRKIIERRQEQSEVSAQAVENTTPVDSAADRPL